MNHSALRFFKIFSWSRICGRVLRGASNARTVAKTVNLGAFSSLFVSILKVLFVHEWMAFCQIIAALRCTISVFISLHSTGLHAGPRRNDDNNIILNKSRRRRRHRKIGITIRWRKVAPAQGCANPRYSPGVGGVFGGISGILNLIAKFPGF